MRIETVTPSTLPSILPLIAGYQTFYHQSPSTEKNEKHFLRYCERHDEGILFAAFLDDKPVGFATLYFLPSSLSATTMCVMNDLFAHPEARNRGIARALVEKCASYAKEKGFDEIEWWTQDSNHVAQGLYNRLTDSRSAWFLYSLDLNKR